MCIGTSCERFERLEKAYSSPMTEVYLFFYNAALQLFVNLNKFMQREDPIIYAIHDQLHSFIKNLLGKFLPATTIKEALASGITCIEYASREKQIPGEFCYCTNSIVLFVA